VYELPKNSDEIKNIPEGVTDEESLETNNSETISDQTEEENSGGITGGNESAFELPEDVIVTKKFQRGNFIQK